MIMHGTTIIGIHRNGKTAICGDGQVTMGEAIVKGKAQKIRKIFDGKVIVGFAGATADAFSLLERFEEKLKTNKGNLKKAAIELAKDWRQDKILRRLEAMLIAGDKDSILLINGVGDVCLLYTSDAADDLPCVDLGGRRYIKKKKQNQTKDGNGL